LGRTQGGEHDEFKRVRFNRSLYHGPSSLRDERINSGDLVMEKA
jgi:hypothetical protein